MEVSKKELLRCLELVQLGVDTHTQSGIQGADCVCFKNSTICAYNTVVAVTATLPSLSFEHECSIVAADLLAFLGRISTDLIKIEFANNSVVFKAGRKKAKFLNKGSSVFNFLSAINIDGLHWQNLPANFMDIISKVNIVSESDIRGVYFLDGKVFSTDSMRINRGDFIYGEYPNNVPLPECYLDTLSITPLERNKVAVKLFADSSDWFHLKKADTDNAIISLKKQPRDEYPIAQLQKHLNSTQTSDKISSTFPSMLLKALNTSIIFAENQGGFIVNNLIFTKNGILVHSQNDTTGEYREFVELDNKIVLDKPFICSMDFNFLKQVLVEGAHFEIAKDRSAFSVYAEHGKVISVVVPMQLSVKEENSLLDIAQEEESDLLLQAPVSAPTPPPSADLADLISPTLAE